MLPNIVVVVIDETCCFFNMDSNLESYLNESVNFFYIHQVNVKVCFYLFSIKM